MDISNITFDEWIGIGLDRGFTGPPVCSTHDGIPMTVDEEQEFEEGNDPCVHVVRLYESLEDKSSVEQNHSPSMWRNSYRSDAI